MTPTPPVPEIAGDSKSVKLASGGTVTLRLKGNWMLFTAAERALLVAMIDAMDQYELHFPNEDAHASDRGSESVCARTSIDAGNDPDHMGRAREGTLEVPPLSPCISSQVCRDSPESADAVATKVE